MILAFDASIKGFRVGVLTVEGQLISEMVDDQPYAHTEFLVPVIQQVLERAGVAFHQLTRILTTKGPGSFTGIRVGLATAAGLQAALGIPVTAVNTLQALVASAPDTVTGQVDAVLDTKCGEVYHQSFTRANGKVVPNMAPVSIPMDKLGEIARHGQIVTHPSTSSVLIGTPHSATVLTLNGMWSAASDGATSDLQPLYVRPANVSQPKHTV